MNSRTIKLISTYKMATLQIKIVMNLSKHESFKQKKKSFHPKTYRETNDSEKFKNKEVLNKNKTLTQVD